MDRQFTITVFLFISHPPPPPRSPHELRIIFLNFASSTTHPAAPETHDQNASARSCSGKHLLSHKDRQFTITVKNPFETCARSACVDYNHSTSFFVVPPQSNKKFLNHITRVPISRRPMKGVSQFLPQHVKISVCDQAGRVLKIDIACKKIF